MEIYQTETIFTMLHNLRIKIKFIILLSGFFLVSFHAFSFYSYDNNLQMTDENPFIQERHISSPSEITYSDLYDGSFINELVDIQTADDIEIGGVDRENVPINNGLDTVLLMAIIYGLAVFLGKRFSTVTV